MTLKTARTIAAVASLSRSDRRIIALPEQFDADPWLLNTPTGAVDLRTGRIRPNRREDSATRAAAVAPGESADCPLWLDFLQVVMRREEPVRTAELVAYLQRVSGYCLTGDTSEAAIFFAYGAGANGKTTFARTLAGILGDYATATASETFMESKVERHPTELAALAGARLVTASEVPPQRAWSESRLKELTGGDPVAARFMRGNFFTFTPVFKPLIIGNHKPAIRTVDEAIRRRLHIIPFTVVIPEKQRDRHFTTKLRTEWPEILRWAIQGCLEWQREGLNPPAEIRAVTNSYFELEDGIGRWLDECSERDAQAQTRTSVLFESRKAWGEASNEHVGSQKSLTQALEERGFKRKRDGRGNPVIVGLKLRGADAAEGSETSRSFLRSETEAHE